MTKNKIPQYGLALFLSCIKKAIFDYLFLVLWFSFRQEQTQAYDK